MTSHIEQLPPELLKRVASFSNALSILNLIRTSKKFYTVCYDAAVFQAVIQNGNGYGNWNMDDLEGEDGGWRGWDPDGYTIGDGVEVWAKLAVADLRAKGWTSQNGTQMLEIEIYEPNGDLPAHFGNAEILVWATKLASLNHPFLKDINIAHLANRCYDAGEEYEKPLGFILTLAILQRVKAGRLDPEGFGFYRGFYMMRSFQEHPASNGIVGKDPNLIDRVPSILGCMFRDPTMPGIIAPEFFGPPSPSRIPFEKLLRLQDPFTTPKDAEICLSLDTMLSREFITEGEWVGYYSMSVSIGSMSVSVRHASFGPPMVGIRFNCSSRVDGSLGLDASGTDSVGTFSLSGSMDSEGNFKMRKVYHNGTTWLWRGRMTLFGMVGVWGVANGIFADRGIVWLWKKDWNELRRGVANGGADVLVS